MHTPLACSCDALLTASVERRRVRRLSRVRSLCARLTALAFCSAVLLPSYAWADEVVITDKARAHFRAGVNMLQDPDGARYAEAYREFKAAYTDSPSWKILGNLGIAAMKLERDGEAIEAFRKYLEEGGSQIEAGERNQVQRDLETLEAGVVWVTVSTLPPGARLTDTRTPLAGRPAVNRYSTAGEPAKIGLHPGSHNIVAELDGYEPLEWTFEAEPGSAFEHTFELQKKQAPTTGQQGPVGGGTMADSGVTRPVPASVYISLATAGALAAGGAVTGVLALGKQRDFENENSAVAAGRGNRETAEDLRSQGQTMNLVTDLLLGGALVAGGAAAFFYFTRPEVKPETNTSWVLAPSALPGGGGVWMQGNF